MKEPADNRPKTKRNRFLLDRPSQSKVAWRIVTVLAVIGVLYAAAVYVLLGSDLVQGRSLAQARLMLLIAHIAYFGIGGAVVLVTTLLMTHRFAGPAMVMQRAIAQMRRGEFDGRLTTRDHDFHKELTEELRHLRDELREREDARADLLVRLEASIDSSEAEQAREVLGELRSGPTASTARSAAGVAA